VIQAIAADSINTTVPATIPAQAGDPVRTAIGDFC
jgi:hypothetical protein